MLKSSGAVVTLLTVLTYVITDLPSKSAAALTVPALSAAQSQVDEVKACKPCRILCTKGYVCKCNRCVRADTQCRPQAIMCKKGYVYKCDRCVRRR